MNAVSWIAPPTPDVTVHLQDRVHLLPQTRQLRAMHTVIRDRHARRDDFVFYSSRIIRLLLESALDLLPFEACDVTTPVGETYSGLRFASRLCGVSIIRAGESMEGELRALVRSIRIGKILIQRDKHTKLPRSFYAHLPADIGERHVLLLDPMLATGGTALMAVQMLLDKGVREDRIVFVAFIACPEGIQALGERYPGIRIVTSSVERCLNANAFMLPGIGDFGDRFFGTTV